MSTPPMKSLFSPLKVGPLHAVAPRRDGAPHPPPFGPAGGYPQRPDGRVLPPAGLAGGLIITEATTISITGRGYLGAPGIYSDAQVAGWRKVTDAVHAKGGRIFLQFWHVGRVGHVDMSGGVPPVAPSVVPFEGIVFTKDGWVPASPHRALRRRRSPGSSRTTGRPPSVPRPPVSTASRSMPGMATSSTSSCRMAPTGGRMPTEGRSRTVPACCSKSMKESRPGGVRIESASGSRRTRSSTRCRTAIPAPCSASRRATERILARLPPHHRAAHQGH